MGEIVVQCEVENTVDRAIADRGLVAESRVRRASIEGIVDTGAVMLMLPQNLVKRLGLAASQVVTVTYADERAEERLVAGPVTVRIGDRITQTQCVVGPPQCEVLIGQLVLAAMDMVADCTNRTLTPRSPDYPNLKMKVARSPVHILAEGLVNGMQSSGRRAPLHRVVQDLPERGCLPGSAEPHRRGPVGGDALVHERLGVGRARVAVA